MKKDTKEELRLLAVGCFSIDVKFVDYLKNESQSSDRVIYLGEYNSEDCMVADFFHELAHLVYEKYLYVEYSRFGKTVGKNFLYFSKLSEEALMWEIGFRLASKFGFEWNYNHLVYRHAYKHLLSYILNEFDDSLVDEEVIKLIKDKMTLKKKLYNSY